MREISEEIKIPQFDQAINLYQLHNDPLLHQMKIPMLLMYQNGIVGDLLPDLETDSRSMISIKLEL